MGGDGGGLGIGPLPGAENVPRIFSMSTLLSASELHELIFRIGHLTVLDVRRPLGDRSHDDYLGGHIPLALYCDPSYQLAGVPEREVGRSPLPIISHLQDSLQGWGLRKDRPTIVYDGGDGLQAARAWWILRWAGLTDVRVLNGGLKGWLESGYETMGGPGNHPRVSDIEIDPGHLPTVGLEEARHWPQHGILVDARTPQRYSGRDERVDLQAGHIPGAINIPERLLMGDSRTIDPDRVRRVMADHGIDDPSKVAVYSGSGLHASLFVQAMHEAGMPGAALMAGGWSQWAGDPENPIERS